MPFNVSNPILYYDKNAFRAAGLDPEKPPTTLDEVKADAQKIKDAGYETGFGLKLNPWYLEQWSAKANTLLRRQRERPVVAGDRGGRSTTRPDARPSRG